MLSSLVFLFFSWLLSSVSFATGKAAKTNLGSSCSSALGAGDSTASDPFWLQDIKHQGTSAFNSDPSTYTVFRNVMDYGAKGDGSTDDTAAINTAISDGNRCSTGCNSSTVTPAVVYFPSGTYVISTPIIALYFTQLIGDAKNPPTLKSTAGFTGIAIIDADPYESGGDNLYVNQDNFFRSVRNFVIDLTAQPDSNSATGLHWQVSQSTSLINVVVNMSTASGNSHQGIFMENGSGGFMGDIVFNGGKFGIWVGNQQFTVRNITVNNAATAIYGLWNWGWTFQGVTINNCDVGFDLATGGLTTDDQSVGAEAIVDAVVSNTPIFLRTSEPSSGSLAGSLVLNNIQLTNVPTAVGVVGGAVVLAGGTTTIDSWGQGNVFSGTSGTPSFTQGTIPTPSKASSLLDSSGRLVQKTHPQYAAYSTDQFVSVKDNGAKGDGTTDDTAALQAVFDQYSGCKIIFFDAGTYIVTSTLTIPSGTQMVGEAWSVIAGSGSAFQDQSNPTVVVKVGNSGDTGVIEITDIIFKTIGSTPGAIVVEWNIAESSAASASMHDSHIILGGAAGTNLQSAQCPSGSDNSDCFSSFMALHLTSGSTAYLEGTWVWNADHDLDGSDQLTIFSGRGILSESQGPVWFIGTASEHHTLYEYSLVNAKDHWMGLIQTETPYYQPSPAPPAPFSIDSTFSDPSFPSGQQAAWGLTVTSSSSIVVFGAGHYSFFQNYGQDCLDAETCQTQIVNIDTGSTVQVYSLSTVGTTYQLSVGGSGVINESDGPNGFAQTATVWTN